VSSKNKESEVERIKKKVDKMYENYGIAVDGMGDGELSTVYRYYFDNKDKLEADYEKSKKSLGKFDEDDII
jgi:uncharacterized protein YpuA (DUF1002 family)